MSSTPPRSSSSAQKRHFSPVPSASGHSSSRNRAGPTPPANQCQRSSAATNSVTRSSPPPTPKFVSGDATPTASPARPSSSSSSCSEDPDNTCAICLGKPSNKSFTDACYHPFCFTCLVEWSKVKPTCPLCQKPFRTIVHNIKENYEFEQYHIFQHLRVPGPVGHMRAAGQHSVLPTATERRGIYELGYYARPTGYTRYRDVSAEFFMNNPAQTHRLIPWLNRELLAILPSSHDLTLVLELILGMITRVDIRSPQMQQVLDLYLRPYTAHFQHEFFCFASSPYDISTFDRNAEYEYRPPYSYQEAVERLRRVFELEYSSSSTAAPSSQLRTEAPGGNGFSAFRPWSPQPGPSRQTSTNSPQPSTSGTQSVRLTYVIASSSEESSDEEDCQIVKVIKPSRERTPVLIDLCTDTDDEESRTTSEQNSEPSSSAKSCPETPEPPKGCAAAPTCSKRPKSVIGAYFPGPSTSSSTSSGPSRSSSSKSHSSRRRIDSRDSAGGSSWQSSPSSSSSGTCSSSSQAACSSNHKRKSSNDHQSRARSKGSSESYEYSARNGSACCSTGGSKRRRSTT